MSTPNKKARNPYLFKAIWLTLAAIPLGSTFAFITMGDVGIVFLIIAIALGICAAAFFLLAAIYAIKAKRGSHLSADGAQIVFGVFLTLLLLATAGWAIYDIQTSVGFLAGLAGALMLMFICPLPAILLVINAIVGIVRRCKARRRKATEQEQIEL